VENEYHERAVELLKAAVGKLISSVELELDFSGKNVNFLFLKVVLNLW